eukprot:s20_g47.t1
MGFRRKDLEDTETERFDEEPPDPGNVNAGVAASEGISQFTDGPCASDPISQFSFDDAVFVERHDASRDPNCDDDGSFVGSPSLGRSGIDISLGRLQMRCAMESDGGFSPSLGDDRLTVGAESSAAFDKVELNPNLNHGSAIQAMSRGLAVSAPKFIWEQDNFLSAVFNSSESVVDQLFKPGTLKRPAPCFVDLTGVADEEAPIVQALKKGACRPVYLDSFSRASVENDDTKRKSFLSGWATLVLINRSAFSSFDGAFDDRRDEPERLCVLRCLEECLASKATSTIGKRLGSMSKFATFCESNKMTIFPLCEKSLYAYMSSVHTNPQSSASAGKSFLEAVRLSAAILGLHGLEECKVPQRVAGLAELLAKKAPCIKQAAALTVAQVSKLEELCCTSESLQDRATIGGSLMMLYSCARASDAARAIRLTVDRVQTDDRLPASAVAGFVEAGVLGHKGARSQVHKRTLLPLVAPMLGVTGNPWWDAWLQARDALGMDIAGELSHPLLSRFTENGTALEIPLQASDIGRFLRNILQVEHRKVNEVRSHSLKVTPLTWLAKAGCALSVRRSLGHHLDPSSKSAVIYSRDAMAPTLRELCRVVQLIASKEFQPDNTRSGRFVSEVRPTVLEGATAGSEEAGSDAETEGSFELPFSEKLAGDTDDSGTDASSDAVLDSEDESLDATTLWDLVEPRHRPNLVQIKPGYSTMMHNQSKVMHLLASETTRFVCGRVVSQRYTAVLNGASSECTRCQMCYTSKLVIAEARLPDLAAEG